LYQYKIGDLLFRRGSDQPVVIIEVKESAKAVWGDSQMQRKLYKVYNNHTGKSQWIPDVELSVKFKTADERNKKLV
jgi:hypothetical protein